MVRKMWMALAMNVSTDPNAQASVSIVGAIVYLLVVLWLPPYRPLFFVRNGASVDFANRSEQFTSAAVVAGGVLQLMMASADAATAEGFGYLYILVNLLTMLGVLAPVALRMTLEERLKGDADSLHQGLLSDEKKEEAASVFGQSYSKLHKVCLAAALLPS